jgi:hypothetical protein
VAVPNQDVESFGCLKTRQDEQRNERNGNTMHARILL